MEAMIGSSDPLDTSGSSTLSRQCLAIVHYSRLQKGWRFSNSGRNHQKESWWFRALQPSSATPLNCILLPPKNVTQITSITSKMTPSLSDISKEEIILGFVCGDLNKVIASVTEVSIRQPEPIIAGETGEATKAAKRGEAKKGRKKRSQDAKKGKKPLSSGMAKLNLSSRSMKLTISQSWIRTRWKSNDRTEKRPPTKLVDLRVECFCGGDGCW